MGALRVIEPGMLTTVQDLGREGFAAFGAPVGGAADSLSLRVGNRLVGNQEGAAGIEMTLLGGVFEFEDDAVVAVVGGEVEARLGEKAVESCAAVQVRRGGSLRIGRVLTGCRVYLCARGGVRVRQVMGSSSTHLAVGIGGFERRALKAGDRVEIGEPAFLLPLPQGGGWGEGAVREQVRGMCDRRMVRLVVGSRFSAAAVRAFVGGEYKVLAQSDRVGLRLDGPTIEAPDGGRMISEGMMFGAVQVPENGKPIVLMADHPTTGGYPVVGCAASVDLPTLWQLRPGDLVRFEPVDGQVARQLYRDREAILAGRG